MRPKKENAMTPTEELRHEHEVILLVLQEAEKQAGLPAPDSAHINEMLDFFVNFAHRCHHDKEEDHLFPKLKERGVTYKGSPIAILLREQSAGRGLVAAMRALARETGDKQATNSLKLRLKKYV
jgi:hemerythrin-like domain-containing protein